LHGAYLFWGTRIVSEIPGVNIESVQILTGTGPGAKNTIKHPHVVGTETHEISDGNGAFSIELPPVSVAAVAGQITGE
jgi:hypothetical protein